MKKNKIIYTTLGLLLLLGVGYLGITKLMTPSGEEALMFDNNVLETINTQLKDLPMDSIRAKSSLIMEKSMEDIQVSIAKGELTYTELTAFYLDRIKTYDKAKNGINAVMEVNPKALEEAKKRDAENAQEKDPIYGMPILLKDNINTKDMATSGGTIALKDFRPSDNAPLVDALLKKKAILLGKTNLSELANFMDEEMPSGYSSKLGQTLNPFGPLRISPQGSSSGSGAGVAANFSAAALGTETTGSIIAPSYIHSIVGFKPSKGLISTEGVLPLSSTMDTVGPMAKNVKDAVVLFNATISDPTKAIKLTSSAPDFSKKRIGVFKGEGSERIIEAVKKAGAQAIELEEDPRFQDNEFILMHDFKIDFNAYVKKYNAPIKSLEDLISFNQKDLAKRAKYGQSLLEDALKDDGSQKEKIAERVKEIQDYIQKLFKDNSLDAIAFVDANSVQIPCTAGYPEITIPFGKNQLDEPTGVTFFGLGGEDEKLINLAYAFEQATQQRLIPKDYVNFLGK